MVRTFADGMRAIIGGRINARVERAGSMVVARPPDEPDVIPP